MSQNKCNLSVSSNDYTVIWSPFAVWDTLIPRTTTYTQCISTQVMRFYLATPFSLVSSCSDLSSGWFGTPAEAIRPSRFFSRSSIRLPISSIRPSIWSDIVWNLSCICCNREWTCRGKQVVQLSAEWAQRYLLTYCATSRESFSSEGCLADVAGSFISSMSQSQLIVSRTDSLRSLLVPPVSRSTDKFVSHLEPPFESLCEEDDRRPFHLQVKCKWYNWSLYSLNVIESVPLWVKKSVLVMDNYRKQVGGEKKRKKRVRDKKCDGKKYKLQSVTHEVKLHNQKNK